MGSKYPDPPAWEPPCELEQLNTNGPNVKIDGSVPPFLICDSVPLLLKTKKMTSVVRG